jgi:hypothetical protein
LAENRAIYYAAADTDRLAQALKRFSSLRVRLVGIVFLAVAPALAWLSYTRIEGVWPSFFIGLCALCAAWLGGEFFILRQVKSIRIAAQKLAAGDLSSRTGLVANPPNSATSPARWIRWRRHSNARSSSANARNNLCSTARTSKRLSPRSASLR